MQGTLHRFLIGLIIMSNVVLNVYSENDNNFVTSEVRAFVKCIDLTRLCLENRGAHFKGDYAFTDYIYTVDGNNFDLNNEIIRLRVYEKTEWNQKIFCVTIKKRALPEQTRKTVFSGEYDTLAEAQEALKNYTLLCSYSRKGWEYYLGDMKMYIEDIQGINPSIEIIAQDRKVIDDLLAQLPIEEVVSCSLPTLVYDAFSKSSPVKNMINYWQNFLKDLNWQELIKYKTPKISGCGLIYDLSDKYARPNESVAIADMRNIAFTEPHYHGGDETELYFVLQGAGLVIVAGKEFRVKTGDVVIIEPNNAHFTIPDKDLVLGVVNTPEFKLENYIPLSETNHSVRFDLEQFNQLNAKSL